MSRPGHNSEKADDLSVGFVRRKMSPTNVRLEAQLERIDAQLAGLYRYGKYLSHRSQINGEAHLMAHCGRELSFGILRYLGIAKQYHSRCSQEISSEHLRSRIVRICNLCDYRVNVDLWCESHESFVSFVHLEIPAPSMVRRESLAMAFDRFTTHVLSLFPIGCLSSTMDSQQSSLVGGSNVMGPQLAEILHHGFRLSPTVDDPGHIYLLAHCGRELSLGLLRRLERSQKGSANPVTSRHRECATRTGGLRTAIARALKVHANHPIVMMWHNNHKQFQEMAHWRDVVPPIESKMSVAKAFNCLSGLIHGAVGLYFETESILCSLLDKEYPTNHDIMQLKQLQLRVSQREYFFGRLKGPKWIKPLQNAGFFDDPPIWNTDLDQDRRMICWPEGGYLVRVAIAEPDAVTEILRKVHGKHDNPIVWDIVARATMKIPSYLAKHAVNGLTNALERTSARQLIGFRSNVADVAIRFAREGFFDEALRVSEHLFFVASAPCVIREWTDSDIDVIRYTRRADWMFPRLQNALLVDKVCARVVEALSIANCRRTVTFLVDRIARVQRLVNDLQEHYRRVSWVPPNRLGVRRVADDIASTLIASVVRLAQNAAERNDARRARYLVDAVKGHVNDDGESVLLRILYIVLAHVGEYRPNMIDRIIRSNNARAPGRFANELAKLFRRQFRNASPEAKMEYANFMKNEMVHYDVTRVLTFFMGNIPPELHQIAMVHGFLNRKPSDREQEIAEIGICISNGSGTHLDSLEHVLSGSAGEVCTFLGSYDWHANREWYFDLHEKLCAYAKSNPIDALFVATCAVDEEWDPSVIEGILSGLRDAAKLGTMDWWKALVWAQKLFRYMSGFDLDRISNAGRWRGVVSHFAMWVHTGCENDNIPSECAASVWSLLETASQMPLTWHTSKKRTSSLASVVMYQLNDSAGTIPLAAIFMALRNDRTRMSSRSAKGSPDASNDVIQERLIRVLECGLRSKERGAVILRALIGTYLTQCYRLIPEWMAANASELFEGGIEDPVSRPTWMTYMFRRYPGHVEFHGLRRWYRMAVERRDEWVVAIGNANDARQVTENLACHLVFAFAHGWISDFEDSVFQEKHANLSRSDWSHAYGEVVVRLKDPEYAMSTQVARRIVGLWEWRIGHLNNDAMREGVVAEAAALWRFIEIPDIESADRIRLGLATVRLAKGQVGFGVDWNGIHALAKDDPDGVLDIVNTILNTAQYVPVLDIKPVLSSIVENGCNDTKERICVLIHELGERGHRGFRDLLPSSRYPQ